MAFPMDLTKPFYEEPRLIIARQPKKRGYRFRYRSEGETHGGIPGEPDPNQRSGSKKFYPTIKIQGYHGPAKVVVTLVTSNQPYHLHAHSMIVNKNPMKGYCIFEMTGNSNVLEIKNIAIQHAVKEKLIETLMDRILQDRFVDKFGWNSALKVGQMVQDIDYYVSILEDRDEDSNFVDRTTVKAVAGHEYKLLRQQATDLSKKMMMNSCRLCFQAFLQDANGKYTQVLDRVFSDEIIDGKTKEGATLKIIRVSAVVSSVKGGDEVWLLADKLNADDVEVRFFKQDKASGRLEWEGYGEFSKSDVYKQAVLIFRTPKYKDENINQPVSVYLQLRRKKDRSCASKPIHFQYRPSKHDKYAIGEKRRKTIPEEMITAFQLKDDPGTAVYDFTGVASSSQQQQPFANNAAIMLPPLAPPTLSTTASTASATATTKQQQVFADVTATATAMASINNQNNSTFSQFNLNGQQGLYSELPSISDSFLNQFLTEGGTIKEEPTENPGLYEVSDPSILQQQQPLELSNTTLQSLFGNLSSDMMNIDTSSLENPYNNQDEMTE